MALALALSRREGDSAAHLRFLRGLPCCACRHPSGPGGEAHHLLRIGGVRGVGMKAPDRWAVPLCRAHHDALHRDGNEDRWFRSVGIDARALAGRLWHLTGEDDLAREALMAAWRAGPAP